MGVIALQTTYQHDLVTLNVVPRKGVARKTRWIGISSTRLFCTVLGLEVGKHRLLVREESECRRLGQGSTL